MTCLWDEHEHMPMGWAWLRDAVWGMWLRDSLRCALAMTLLDSQTFSPKHPDFRRKESTLVHLMATNGGVTTL